MKRAHLPLAILTALLLPLLFGQPAAVLAAAEPVVFHPAYAPGPADNPLKGFVPYAGQGRKFPHALEFSYLPLAAVMTGTTNFNWTPLEKILDGVASRGCQSVLRFYLEYPQRQKPGGYAAYHYLGCAKTFALMGRAFADATLTMMKNQPGR